MLYVHYHGGKYQNCTNMIIDLDHAHPCCLWLVHPTTSLTKSPYKDHKVAIYLITTCMGGQCYTWMKSLVLPKIESC